MAMNGQIIELPVVLISTPQKMTQNWRGYLFAADRSMGSMMMISPVKTLEGFYHRRALKPPAAGENAGLRTIIREGTHRSTKKTAPRREHASRSRAGAGGHEATQRGLLKVAKGLAGKGFKNDDRPTGPVNHCVQARWCGSTQNA
jgi:hypothetical protein